jgi:dienelactone hydrolase
VRRAAVILLAGTLLAGCGSSSKPGTTTTTTATGGIQRLTFAYDTSAPLEYVNHGRINATSYPIAIYNVSFISEGLPLDGFLLVPPGSAKKPAVVFMPGSGGDRSQLLTQAAWLAARNVVTLTITAPSSLVTTTPKTVSGLLAQAKSLTVHDVIAVRRAVDVLQHLPEVDPNRIGYVGWSEGARTGTYVAAEEPRVKALALLSAGAAPLSSYVAQAPAGSKKEVKRVIGSIDPIRYIGWAKSGTVLLEDGTKDTVVPRSALLNIAHAAPKGTILRWYDAPHALDEKAYGDAFTWLTQELHATGRVPGAVAG